MFWFFSRFGGDLLSHVLRRSTIGATVLNGRVRDGIGCFTGAVTTKPRKEPNQVKYMCVLCMLLDLVLALLLLDQIKPIGQLVPVS